MKITHLVFASTLVVSCNAWAELEVLQTGIQLAPAQKPAARGVGSVWRAMKDGQPYAITTISETNSSETFEDTDGCNRTRPKTFYSPSTHWANCGGNAGSATVRLNGEIFPLQVGKRWSFDVDGSDFDGGSWRTARDCEVQDAARVRTSLGENDTFKIVCTDNLNTRTGYYSPKLGTPFSSIITVRKRRNTSRTSSSSTNGRNSRSRGSAVSHIQYGQLHLFGI